MGSNIGDKSSCDNAHDTNNDDGIYGNMGDYIYGEEPYDQYDDNGDESDDLRVMQQSKVMKFIEN